MEHDDRPMRQSDHDLLVTLHVEMTGVRTDIKDLKDGVKSSVDDHEARIRTLERRQWITSGAAGMVSAGVALLAQWFINHK